MPLGCERKPVHPGEIRAGTGKQASSIQRGPSQSAGSDPESAYCEATVLITTSLCRPQANPNANKKGFQTQVFKLLRNKTY